LSTRLDHPQEAAAEHHQHRWKKVYPTQPRILSQNNLLKAARTNTPTQ
jgi:hypothetical protein